MMPNRLILLSLCLAATLFASAGALAQPGVSPAPPLVTGETPEAQPEEAEPQAEAEAEAESEPQPQPEPEPHPELQPEPRPLAAPDQPLPEPALERPQTPVASEPPVSAPAPRPAPAVAPPPPIQQIIQIPIPTASSSGSDSDSWERVSRLIPGLPGEGLELRHLLFLLLAFVVFDTGIRRLRNRLPREGVFPLLFAILQVAVRVSIFFVALGLPAVLASPSFAPVIIWVLLAAGAALGWSARDFLPDLLAGVILLFERRIRRGMWISGEGYAGIVIWLGLRSTWLRDSHGHRVGVPNRRLMESPVVADASGDTVQEVALRIGSSRPAHAIRQALRDAVLTSPWIFPDCDPVVLREPTDPELWRVRARLLESHFATRFEGELLERAEEILEDRSALPPEKPSEPLFDAMLD